MCSEIHIIRADWSEYQNELTEVRTKVFVDEMDIDPELEQDGRDKLCWHVLAQVETDKNPAAIGAARMSKDGKIGRMAVLSVWRSKGVGGGMLKELIQLARDRELPGVHLSAQQTAVRFYLAHELKTVGRTYEEVDIVHQNMILNFD